MPQAAQTPQAAARPVPGEVAASSARSAAPKGRRSPSWPPAVPPAWSTPIRFMALSSSACTGSPLRCLSGVDRRSLSHATARARSLRPTGATAVAPARRKSRRTTSRLRATVHRWPSPSGPAGKAWRGKRGRAKLARIYQGPSTATFFSKLSVMFRSDTDYANSVSKEIGSDSGTRNETALARRRNARPWLSRYRSLRPHHSRIPPGHSFRPVAPLRAREKTGHHLGAHAPGRCNSKIGRSS